MDGKVDAVFQICMDSHLPTSNLKNPSPLQRKSCSCLDSIGLNATWQIQFLHCQTIVGWAAVVGLLVGIAGVQQQLADWRCLDHSLIQSEHLPEERWWDKGNLFAANHRPLWRLKNT